MELVQRIGRTRTRTTTRSTSVAEVSRERRRLERARCRCSNVPPRWIRPVRRCAPRLRSAVESSEGSIGRRGTRLPGRAEALARLRRSPRRSSRTPSSSSASWRRPSTSVERVVKLRSDDATNRVNLADALNRVGKHEEALLHARHAVDDLGFKERQGRRIVIDALLGLRRTDDALRAIERVVALGEDDEWLWSESGLLLLEVGRPKDALAWLEAGGPPMPEGGPASRRQGHGPRADGAVRGSARSPGAGAGGGSVIRARLGGRRPPGGKAGRPAKAVELAREGLAEDGLAQLRWTLGGLLKQTDRLKEAREAWAPLVAGTPCHGGGLAPWRSRPRPDRDRARSAHLPREASRGAGYGARLPRGRRDRQ